MLGGSKGGKGFQKSISENMDDNTLLCFFEKRRRRPTVNENVIWLTKMLMSLVF
jgi:hypothetical protein